MIDAIDAVGVTVFEALAAANLGVPVFQHVPGDTPAPLVIIGDINDATRVARDEPDLRMPLTVSVLTEGEERVPCTNIVGKVIDALDGAVLEHNDFSVRPVMESWSAVLADEGGAYLGAVQLTVFALKI